MENSGELTAHLTSAAAIVYGIEYLKRWNAFRWINVDSKVLNRWLSLVISFFISLGITYNYDAKTGDLVIHNITWTTLYMIWDWAKQYLAQQLIYDGVVQKQGTNSETKKEVVYTLDPPRNSIYSSKSERSSGDGDK